MFNKSFPRTLEFPPNSFIYTPSLLPVANRYSSFAALILHSIASTIDAITNLFCNSFFRTKIYKRFIISAIILNVRTEKATSYSIPLLNNLYSFTTQKHVIFNNANIPYRKKPYFVPLRTYNFPK